MKKLTILLALISIAAPLYPVFALPDENPMRALQELRIQAFYALTEDGNPNQVDRLEALIQSARKLDCILATKMQEKIVHIRAAQGAGKPDNSVITE